MNVVIFNDIDDEPDGGEGASSVALTRLAASDVALPAAPELPVDALARLPELGDRGGDPYWRLATAFLVGYPPHSSRADHDRMTYQEANARHGPPEPPRQGITPR